MKAMRYGCCWVLLLGGGAWAQEATPAPPAAGTPPPKCLEALVSPVSGHAECVNPPGAPVDPPPPRPDACNGPEAAQKAACKGKPQS